MRAALLLAALLVSGPALAQTPAAPQQLTPQQERMRSCNAEARTKNLAGNDRQHFMSGCLAGNAGAAFKTEAEAKRACGGDPVVWANSDSQIFHAEGSQFFGKTSEGAYMCQAAAGRAGYRAAGARTN
jgi:hypothetical protein